MQNTLCVLPFYHLDISPSGSIKPCCDFDRNIVPDDINVDTPNVFDNVFFKNIRTQTANNKPVTGCEKCYVSEQRSNNSFRIEMLHRYKQQVGIDFVPPETPRLVYLNVALSNLCNSKCRMCSSRYSTSWYNDSKILGLPIPHGAVTQTNSLDDYDLSNVMALNLVGGEPLMEQTRIINLLKKCNLSRLTLVITTNATLRPSAELTELIKQCQNVEWDLSVDAYGPLNDFLRKGSVWSDIDSNILWYYENFASVKMNSVISIYNANCFNELIEYVKTNFPNIKHRQLMVTGVDWMQIHNLPLTAKDKLKNKLIMIKEKHNLPMYDLILNSLDTPGNFENFKTMDAKLNEIRQEHWKECNLELYDWIQD
jgi:MoaA/NifB/PqqE/SkfB family radical SAM enzyme